MKILWAITVLKRAGAEQSLVNIAPALLKRGFELEVAALRPPYDLAPDLEALGVRVHRLDVGRHDLPRSVSRLAGLMRQSRPDILHSHLFWAGLSGGLARLMVPNVRAVSTYHNVDYDLFPAVSPGARAAKRLYARLMRGFDGHTGVSQEVARHMKHHLRLRRVDVIPNAFDTTQIRPNSVLDRATLRLRYGLPRDAFVLVMPARLVPEKGHCFALGALSQLRFEGRDAFLLMLGDGPQHDAITQLIAAQDLQACAALRPPLPHAELFPLLQACDAFALPSTHEGFGMAPAEAMALQLPVVAFDIAGVADVATPDSALLCPPRDVAALAARFAALMDDAALRRDLAQRGRQHVVARFDTAHVAAQWDDFYRRAAL